MIEKKIKFNNMYWLVQLDGYLKVLKYNDDNTIQKDFSVQGTFGGKTMQEQFENAVIYANKYYLESNGLSDSNNYGDCSFDLWDGDMDAEYYADRVINKYKIALKKMSRDELLKMEALLEQY